MATRYADEDHLTERVPLVAAVYLVLRRDGQVLLQRRAGTGYRDGSWASVAGHVDPDESAVAAVVREAAEEVGIEVQVSDLVPLTVMHRLWPGAGAVEQRVDLFFTSTRWTGDPHLVEPERADALDWFELTDLPEPVVPHEKHVLDALAAGQQLPAILVWRTDLNRPVDR